MEEKRLLLAGNTRRVNPLPWKAFASGTEDIRQVAAAYVRPFVQPPTQSLPGLGNLTEIMDSETRQPARNKKNVAWITLEAG